MSSAAMIPGSNAADKANNVRIDAHPTYTALNAPVDYTPLTAEGILIFCQSRLKEMDQKIAEKMAGQHKLVALQSTISDIASALKAARTGNDGDEAAFDDKPLVDQLSAQLQTAIDTATACGSESAARMLQQAKIMLNKGKDGGTDGLVSAQELKEMGETLDKASGACASGAELSMIELQSIVSKRATTLQLTTGLMSSINEAAKSIAANMGR